MEYKLVPVEPTEAMIDDGMEALQDEHAIGRYGECPGFSWSDSKAVYAAMLVAAPSPEWVYDRFPTREQADEGYRVWFYSCGRVVLVYYEYVTLSASRDTCWMPKPRQQPPEPPALQQEGE